MHLAKPRLAHTIQPSGPLIGRFLPTLKHLGAWLTPNGSEHYETQKRLTATARVWNALGTAWFHLPRGVRRALFVVQSAGLSGLEAAVLTPGEARRLDVAVCKKLRALEKVEPIRSLPRELARSPLTHNSCVIGVWHRQHWNSWCDD